MEERYKKIGNLFFLGLFFAISVSIMVIAGLKMSNVKYKLQEQKDKINRFIDLNLLMDQTFYRLEEFNHEHGM